MVTSTNRPHAAGQFQARRWPPANNAVLKAAAEFGASRPDMKSADVLAIADRWVAWVNRPA